MKDSKEKKDKTLPVSVVMGAIALVFLVTGYQTALFVHRAAALKIVADKDRPDTVYIIERLPAPGASPQEGEKSTFRRNSPHAPSAQGVRRQYTPRAYENFPFDPNTVSVEDLIRLGFSSAQAQAIDNYRAKGGRFRRKQDFAKSYVVEDSTYKRLEPYIDIPLTDINKADSAAFDALPGIGPWFASRMVSYRKELHGYSCVEQLLDIKNFGEDRLASLADLITVSPPKPYPLWSLPEDSLRTHPYIDRHAARSIVLFRENTPREEWSVAALEKAGILDRENAGKLSLCLIADDSD